MGQTEKNSVRAYVFRFAPELGHCSAQSACLKGANFGSDWDSRCRKTAIVRRIEYRSTEPYSPSVTVEKMLTVLHCGPYRD
jgi:hypothetical protein